MQPFYGYHTASTYFRPSTSKLRLSLPRPCPTPPPLRPSPSPPAPRTNHAYFGDFWRAPDDPFPASEKNASVGVPSFSLPAAPGHLCGSGLMRYIQSGHRFPEWGRRQSRFPWKQIQQRREGIAHRGGGTDRGKPAPGERQGR